MGVSGADHIQTELLTGLPANTPVAIIENASLPEQRQALTQLDRLTFTLNETGLKSPSILVVGNVVQACAQIFQTAPSSPTLPLHANM
jgi:uroporphyrin-III C-methyltransferase